MSVFSSLCSKALLPNSDYSVQLALMGWISVPPEKQVCFFVGFSEFPSCYLRRESARIWVPHTGSESSEFMGKGPTLARNKFPYVNCSSNGIRSGTWECPLSFSNWNSLAVHLRDPQESGLGPRELILKHKLYPSVVLVSSNRSKILAVIIKNGKG